MSSSQNFSDPLTRKELRKQRVDQLVKSCRDELLSNIAAPFNLDPAIFGSSENILQLYQPESVAINVPRGAVWNDKGTVREHGESIIPVSLRTVGHAAKSEIRKVEKNIKKDLKALGEGKSAELDKWKIKGIDQVVGWALGEFANGALIEVKIILAAPEKQEPWMDKLLHGLERQAERVKGEATKILKNRAGAGLDDFLGKLFGYIVGKLVKTFKKFGSLIKDSAGKLLGIIKTIINPPPGMSSDDVARHATKSVAAIVLATLGALLSEALAGFIASIPLLAPFAEVVALALAGIVSGLSAAVVMFWIDRFFDWLGESDAHQLEAQLAQLHSDQALFEHLGSLWNGQIANSHSYASCLERSDEMGCALKQSAKSLEDALACGLVAIDVNSETLNILRDGFSDHEVNQQYIADLMLRYESI